jgi:hypothetical protein
VVRWNYRCYCCNCVLLLYRRHPERLGAIRRDGFQQRELLDAWHPFATPLKEKPAPGAGRSFSADSDLGVRGREAPSAVL